MVESKSKSIRMSLGRAYRAIRFRQQPLIGFKSAGEWISNSQERLRSDPPANRIETIVAADSICRTPPKTVEAERYWLFDRWSKATEPAIQLAEISEGRVYGKNGAIISPDHYLLADLCPEMGNDPANHSMLGYGSLPLPKKIDGKLGVLSSLASSTYYHFLFDIIPRIQFIESAKVDYYYVNCQMPFQKQLLELCGIPSRKILPASKHKHYLSDKLFATSKLSQSGSVSQPCWQFVRRLLDRRDSRSRSHQKIYISRGDVRHRQVTNEGQVIETLEKFGFVPVQLTGLSIPAQIELFFRAEQIVSPHGAGLSNLVFSPAGAKVLELFAPQYVNVCYWTLCQHNHLEYHYLIGEGQRPKTAESPGLQRAHITIDLEKLVASVEQLA